MRRGLYAAAMMMMMLGAWTAYSPGAGRTEAATPPRRGILLGDLSWDQAEPILTKDTVVVVPVAAGSKEHGRHLRLDNDFVIEKWMEKVVLERCEVVVAPPIAYHYFPSFVEYPGSTSLRRETARDVVVDVVGSLAHHGPRRFYALNTGYSTVAALEPAAAELAKDGILLRWSHIGHMTHDTEKRILQQKRGSHADEMETSLMLSIAPDRVDMSKAEKDDEHLPGPRWSRTGAFGDPTLATKEKGDQLAAAIAEATVAEIDSLRRAPLPGSEKPSEKKFR